MNIKQTVALTFIYLSSYGLMPSQQIDKNSDELLKTVDEQADVLTANYIRSYPNPTNGPLTISMGRTYAKVIVEVRSISGKLVSKEQYDNTSEVITDINAPAGIYLVRISGDEKNLMIYRITKE